MTQPLPQQHAPLSLLWPGDHRAGELFADAAVLAAMVRVEQEWLAVLVDVGIAPPDAAAALTDVPLDAASIAVAAENAGNPAVPLVPALRAQLSEPAATWLHRGLTSQDVLDTALMLCAAEVMVAVRASVRAQVLSMTNLAETHRATPMLARTLAQPAVGSTFGLRVANWLTGVLDAAEAIDSACDWLRVQCGGAVGSMAATAELDDGAAPASLALRAAELLAARLGLRPAAPWHTSRRPVAAIGDALVACTDAWGRIARDVITGSRAEIAELREPAVEGRGGSSTMPGKRNPILSVLLRRAALTGPTAAAALHLAVAEAGEERSDGAWHAEWETLRTLARRTVTAGSHAAELLAGLEVDAAAMARNLAAHLAAAGGSEPEQRSMAAVAGRRPRDTYRGATDLIIDELLNRATEYLSAPGQ